MQSFSKRPYILLVLVLTLTLMLVACGEVATVTPAPTTKVAEATATPVPATTAPAATNTAVPPTAAPTTAAPTVAPTIAPTTAAPTVAPTTAVTSEPGTTEIAVDPAIASGFARLAPDVKDLVVKMFVSDTSAQDLANGLDTYFTKQGYKFTFPGHTTVVKSPAGTAFGSFYTKSGSPDILVGVMITSDDPTQLSANLKDLALPGAFDLDLTKLAAQVRGHKSLTFSASGTDLSKAIFTSANAPTPAATTAATTTAPAATTAVASGNGPTEIQLDPSVLAGLTKSLPTVKDLKVQMFVSDDKPEDLIATTETALYKVGYKFGLQNASTYLKTGNTSFTGYYSQTGSPDILLILATLSDDPAQLYSNINELGFQTIDTIKQPQLVTQFMGHKSALLVISGTDLIKTTNGKGDANLLTLTQIYPDTAIQAGFKVKLPKVADLNLKMYVSNAPFDQVAMSSESTLLNQGYKFVGASGQTTIYKITSGQSYAGSYTQTGQPDFVVAVTNLDTTDSSQLAANIQELNIPNIDQADGAAFASQIHGRKTLVLVVSGTDLLKALNS